MKRITPRLYQPATVVRGDRDADNDLIRAAAVNVRRGCIFCGVEPDEARTRRECGDVTAGMQCLAVMHRAGGIQALSL